MNSNRVYISRVKSRYIFDCESKPLCHAQTNYPASYKLQEKFPLSNLVEMHYEKEIIKNGGNIFPHFFLI